MNRSEMREQAFVLIYESEFFKDKPLDELEEIYSENIAPLSAYGKELFNGTVSLKNDIDAKIEPLLKGWKINRISKVNLSILRFAIFELDNMNDVPENVVINEAVELAKKYSGKEDSAFVNGILGSYSRSK